jgi:ATP-dependent helicase/nuclease subunit A
VAERATPGDQHQRDRLVAELDRTLFVEAGAGSGKTTQLVRRIVELLLSGTVADIAQLAAITFTEAAAAELRDRVRERLEREADAHAPGTTTRARIDAALDHLDDAAISTLHGFAQRLLAGHPIEAGLPPGFEVEDEIASAVREREHWSAFLDDLFADAEFEPVLRRAFTLGLTMRQLGVVAYEFAENWDRLEHHRFPEHGLAPIDVGPVIDALDEVIAFAAAATDGAKSFANALAAATPLRDRLLAEPDPDHQLLVLLHEPPKYPTLSNVTKPELVRLKELVADAKAAQRTLLENLRLDALEPILGRISDYTLASADERRRDGRIRFHDLLVLARRMLTDHATVRRELGARFQVLLIDEFQDTDPLQIEIALLLALRDPEVVPDRWHDAAVDEGRLFFVGDPKQSIYRFRRADISVFERVRDRFSHNGVVELTVNFRTVPSVLDWVNAIFHELIGPEAQDGQPRYLALDASRPDLSLPSPVVVVGDEMTVRSVAELREHESRRLAATIAAMKDEQWMVHPDGEPDPRPVQYRDVTILIPSRQVLGELERALDRHGVPYRVESRSLVFGTDEVRELLAILQAIDDPGDEVAVIAALRSPAFACSDAALARYRAANPSGKRWNYARGWHRETFDGLDPHDPVLAAMAALGDLHEQRVWLPVNELVEKLIRERRMVELTTARRRPRDHWRRLRMVQSEARAFVEAGGQALADFIAYMEEQADEKASRIETVVSERDDDAVRILTIHGSKGLEFPVVVLAGLGIEYRPPHNRVFWTEDGPEIALGSQDGDRFETPGYAEIRDREQRLDRFERDRLLYVAATRARDHLVVSLFRQPNRPSAAARIAEVLDALDEPLHRVIEVPGDRAARRAAAVPSPAGTAPAGVLDLEPFAAERARLLAGASRGGAVAPTTLAKRALADVEPTAPAEPTHAGAEADAGRDAGGHPGGEVDAQVEADLDVAVDGTQPHRFGRRGQGGTAVGRAVHATLQVIDLATGADLARLATYHAAAEGIPDRADAVAALARSALASPSIQAANASGRHWREMFVSAPLGAHGTIVEGYIDLLYESTDGDLVVVDYKTDQARDDAELAASASRYRLQGAAYAAVLEAALGRKVSRCVFVFARAGGAVERVIDDLPAAIDEVLAALG